MSGRIRQKSSGGKTAAIGIFLLILLGIWIIVKLNGGGKSGISGATDKERIEYINSFGWEVAAAADKVEDIRIPANFDEAYEQYNALQKEQGFDLRPYRAYSARQYTYRITNYEGQSPAVPICVHLIVIDGEIVGADISSSEANGFVTVLAKK